MRFYYMNENQCRKSKSVLNEEKLNVYIDLAWKDKENNLHAPMVEILDKYMTLAQAFYQIRKALVDLVGLVSEDDIDKLELAIRATEAPEIDKTHAINALTALRET
jgi:hypothetical protein